MAISFQIFMVHRQDIQMNNAKNSQKILPEINELLQSYLNRGIITLSDVLSDSEDTIMNRILKRVHPYKIYFSASDQRWHTQVEDLSNIRGYRQIARKKEADIQKYLLKFYNIQGTKIYTFNNLYQELKK